MKISSEQIGHSSDLAVFSLDSVDISAKRYKRILFHQGTLESAFLTGQADLPTHKFNAETTGENVQNKNLQSRRVFKSNNFISRYQGLGQTTGDSDQTCNGREDKTQKTREGKAFQTSSTPTKSGRPKSRRPNKVKIITTPWIQSNDTKTLHGQNPA